ncbi:MAG: hypothetical protein ABIP81_02295 [Terriglobales bacterium]
MGRLGIRIALIVLMLGTTFAAQSKSRSLAEAPVRDTPTAAKAPPADPQFGQRRNQEEPLDARMERARLKAWNKERYENLQKDTNKLLVLATELKESVDKANKDMLSLQVIRKTEEVEKLAKSVREKMKAF